MAGLAQNLAFAEQAITYTKTKVGGASNMREDRLAGEGGIEAVIARYRTQANPQPRRLPTPQTFQDKRMFFERQSIPQAPPLRQAAPQQQPVSALVLDLHNVRTDQRRRQQLLRNYLGRNLTRKEQIEFSADTAEFYHIGNCWEQAAVAMIYLRDRGTTPMDFMYFTTPGYDHAFLIIGRAQFSNLSTLSTWGPDAVWCDPWQCRTGRAFAIADLVAGRVRNLDAVYKLNTAELIGAGKLYRSIASGSPRRRISIRDAARRHPQLQKRPS